MSAFDPVTRNYLAATSTATYAVTGTSRYDMVTVTGTSTSDIKYPDPESEFNIFPNPASSVVNLSNPVNYKIFDLNGKILLTGSEKTSIDISSIKKGVYILKTDLGEIRKLIIQ